MLAGKENNRLNHGFMGGYVKYSGRCGHGCHFIHHDHHRHGCHGHHGLDRCEGEFIGRIPVLRYLKEPVRMLDDLYVAFPLGGQPGDFAFVYEARCFAYWHQGRNRWELISLVFTASDLIRNLGLRADKLQSGHVLMWNEDVGGFVPYLIRAVDAVPTGRDLDGLYLVSGIGVYVVGNGVVTEIVRKSSLVEAITVRDFQADWKETDNTKLSFIWNKPSLDLPASPSNVRIDLVRGGTAVGFFTLNQSEPKAIDLGAGAGADFDGITLVVHSVADFGAYNLICDVPDGAFDSVAGKFVTSSLMRVGYGGNFTANPFGGFAAGKTVRVRLFGFDGPAFDLKHYASGAAVQSEDLFFEPYLYVRYEAVTDTLWCK